MASFSEQQRIILQYITENYYNYLPVHLQNPTFTVTYLDFDKFKNDFTFFIDFNRINFPSSQYEDDCKNVEQLALTVYLVFRNNINEVLKENCLDASWAFYKMIGDLRIKTINDFSIESFDLYDYVEGNKCLVISEVSCIINIDIER